jgi:protein-S-isoprenylcysteine O-methyltransferase Ste14
MDTFLLVLLGFIGAIVIFSVPYLISYGRVKGVAEEQGRRSDWLLALVWFFALAVALYERLVLNWTPFGGWPLTVGGILIALGIGIRLACRRTLGRFYVPQLKIQPDHQLVTGGLYRYVRHPMYTAELLLNIGLTLALGSIVGLLLMAAGVLAVLVYRIHVEESLLAAQFGDEWREYIKQTRYRLIPSVY